MSTLMRRARAALLLLTATLAISAGLLLATAGTAQAAPAPIPTTSPTPTASPTPTPTDPLQPIQETGGKGVSTALFGTDGVDLSHYDLGWDDGAWNNFYRHLWGNLTALVWVIHRWIVQVGVWFLTWTFKFGLAKMLLAPVNQVFLAWQHSIVEPLGLTRYFFGLTCAWVGYVLIRGRWSEGAGELATSMIVSGLAAVILANPGSALLGDNGLLGHTRDITFGISALTFGDSAAANETHPDPSTVIAPMKQAYIQAFIVEPHMILDWGQSLDNDPKCLAIYQALITQGAWGSSDTPRDMMSMAGCNDEVAFNHDPSPERFAGAAMVGLAGFLMTVLMIIICGVVNLAIAMLAVAVIRLVPAILAGLLPSFCRGFMWSTLQSVAKSVSSVVASVMFLTIFLVTLRAVLADNAMSLFGRLTAMDLFCVFGFVFRARIANNAHRMASSLTQKLAHSKATGASHGGGWLRPAAAGAGAGFAAAELWRHNREEMGRALAPAKAAAAKAGGFGAAVGRIMRPGHTPAPGAASGATTVTSTAKPGVETSLRTWALGAKAAATAATSGAPAARKGTTTASGGKGPGQLHQSSTVAQRLSTELGRSRSGRIALITAKATRLAGKATWASTVGAPVTVTRAGKKARTATSTAASAMRAQLNAAAGNSREYGREWGSSVATLTGVRATRKVVTARRSPAPPTDHPRQQ